MIKTTQRQPVTAEFSQAAELEILQMHSVAEMDKRKVL